ncbi:MAG: GntR family transcriptional regulator [Clostridiales bacterium]|nr:GntR family transcriptional regulator [Clostridiales bacterium]
MIQLNENSQVPIYQQVYDGLLQLIIHKVLEEGDKLPSVRELALMLEINPNTIQKAYKSLEKDRFIESEKGKGNFVCPYNQVLSNYKTDLDQKFEDVIKELILVGETKESIIDRVSKIIKESIL